MAIDKEVIRAKLALMEEFIARAESMEFTDRDLLEEIDIQDALLFRLQQGVEQSIDIANHITSALALPFQDKARDVFLLLGKDNIISKDLAGRLGNASGFRNLVVHGYADVDFKLVARNYKNDLNDLRQFAKKVNNFLSRQR